jgi:hypothetical protein
VVAGCGGRRRGLHSTHNTTSGRMRVVECLGERRARQQTQHWFATCMAWRAPCSTHRRIGARFSASSRIGVEDHTLAVSPSAIGRGRRRATMVHLDTKHTSLRSAYQFNFSTSLSLTHTHPHTRTHTQRTDTPKQRYDMCYSTRHGRCLPSADPSTSATRKLAFHSSPWPQRVACRPDLLTIS